MTTLYCNPLLEPCYGLTFNIAVYYLVMPFIASLTTQHQSLFVDVVTWHFSNNETWVEEQLKRATDISVSSPDINVVVFGNMAYLTLHAPSEHQRIFFADYLSKMVEHNKSKYAYGYVLLDSTIDTLQSWFFDSWLYVLEWREPMMKQRDLIFLRDFIEKRDGKCKTTSEYDFYPY